MNCAKLIKKISGIVNCAVSYHFLLLFFIIVVVGVHFCGIYKDSYNKSNTIILKFTLFHHSPSPSPSLIPEIISRDIILPFI
jgi:hypothetical protein